MRNERNAGRKSRINEKELDSIKARVEAGESVSSIATEYVISRQALYKKLRVEDSRLIVDYVVNDAVSTRIEMDVTRERLHIANYAVKISDRAFGLDENPGWNELRDFLESEYFKSVNTASEIGQACLLCNDVRKSDFSLKEILESENSNITLVKENDRGRMPIFSFTKRDILYTRTDTDGYQLKALSYDRKFFVKSQAFISGKEMDDWLVEVIASSVCQRLNIPCVIQHPCKFVYGAKRLSGVYSKNFELDGYMFVSFESLLERNGLSSREEYFIKLSAVEKLKWCAKQMAKIGSLPFEYTLKYMLDLALIDIIVGNVDRHTRNFGLFFNTNTGTYEIPLIFDNGMGLFEHDSYKDNYKTFDEAMMSVYVAPYGEDPFDMYHLLDEEFDLQSVYPELGSLKIDTAGLDTLAKEYIERVQNLWQK